ncbi:restriction endonuclease [Candidatus Parcubacteria bacterium]|nr:restriction endonuclease [Candidatus Parcubacteria bacterium]
MNIATLAEKQIIIVKANGKHEAFDEEKLRSSLLRAGGEPEDAQTVIEHVREKLHDGMSTHDIYSHAFSTLHHLHAPVAKRYSVRRAIMNLGPTGFLFEDLVAAILKDKGFETMTRQTVLGGCVPHEVDVVAWNEKKLMMVEAKFHNELGTKSDLKVALYVKARVDDLKDNVFSYGGKERKVTDGWLVTNTKFSSTAIHYGVCQNLVMIGWNYPEKGNLQDLIEESPRLMELVLGEGLSSLKTL